MYYPDESDSYTNLCIDSFNDTLITSEILFDVGDGDVMTGYILVSDKIYNEMLNDQKMGLTYDLSYLIKQTQFGIGLQVYTTASEYLLHKAEANRLKLLELEIDGTKLINTLKYSGYKKLAGIYNYLIEQRRIENNEGLYEYIRNKSKQTITGICGLHVEGRRINKQSRVYEYIGSACTIYDTNIIKSFKLVGSRFISD